MSLSGMGPHVGEGFAGDGANAAHVNVVVGLSSGPVGVAWTTALATPRQGHVPFVAVARPGVPVQPFTLFVNKATIENDEHGRLTWGAAQAGIAAGVGDASRARILPRNTRGILLIAAVWVNPAAGNENEVFENNRAATIDALKMASKGGIDRATALEAMADPANPYFR